ncbi:MAG: aminopeptidase P family N-terminal domain-containing protein, partial [Hyphomicrobiaceae bacterium]
SSGPRTKLGLASPSDRIIAVGEPMQVAVGFWGALTCRAGWIASDEKDLPQAVGDYVERLAGPYFDCAAEWYEMVGIGVSGGAIDAMVKSRLGDPFFGVALNPGHLIHLDEWMNTPIFPGSTETLRSGQAIQLDIIPATGTDYATANVEDGIALLDKPGRDAFRDKYPEAWLRIESRRAFLAETLGIRLKPEVLPFSNLAGCLAPFLLAPERVFARRK